MLRSTEVLLQSPDALLPTRPTEVTDAPEQLSENRRLLLGQSWFEILQHFLRCGLAVHTGLESYKVAQIHQQLIVPSGWSWGGACSSSSRAICLILRFFSLAGGQAEVITDSHLGQQGGGGEWGRVWHTLWPLPTKMSSWTRLLWQRLLYDSSILKREKKWSYSTRNQKWKTTAAFLFIITSAVTLHLLGVGTFCTGGATRREFFFCPNRFLREQTGEKQIHFFFLFWMI